MKQSPSDVCKAHLIQAHLDEALKLTVAVVRLYDSLVAQGYKAEADRLLGVR